MSTSFIFSGTCNPCYICSRSIYVCLYSLNTHIHYVSSAITVVCSMAFIPPLYPPSCCCPCGFKVLLRFMTAANLNTCNVGWPYYMVCLLAFITSLFTDLLHLQCNSYCNWYCWGDGLGSSPRNSPMTSPTINQGKSLCFPLCISSHKLMILLC